MSKGTSVDVISVDLKLVSGFKIYYITLFLRGYLHAKSCTTDSLVPHCFMTLAQVFAMFYLNKKTTLSKTKIKFCIAFSKCCELFVCHNT